MKKIIMLSFLLAGTLAKGQYYQLWTNNSSPRQETFNDGLCSAVNYHVSPSGYFNVGWGTSYSTAASDTSDEARYLNMDKNGVTVHKNIGIAFRDQAAASGAWFHTSGKGICELKKYNFNGGYLGVGSVGDNVKTSATVPGGSDGFFTRVAKNGSTSYSFRYDFAGGADVFTAITRSLLDTNRFYICGYSGHGSYTELLVMAVKSNGTILWNKAIRLQEGANAFTHARATGIAEVGGSGKIMVAGSFLDSTDNHKEDGLILLLSKSGNVSWVARLNLSLTASGGFTDVYTNVIQTQTPGIIGICGYSDFSSAGPAWYDNLLTKMDTNGTVHSICKYRQRDAAGMILQSKGYDLREFNTVFFITGPVYTATDTLSGLMAITPGTPAQCAQYHSQTIDTGYGIDLATGGATVKPRLFTNANDLHAAGQSDGYLVGADFNGNTCDLCFPQLGDSISVIKYASSPGYTCLVTGQKTKLASKLCPYTHDDVCRSSTACGLRLSDEETNTDQTKLTLQVYPNPVSDMVTLKMDQDLEHAHLRIYNMPGSVCMEANDCTIKAGNEVRMELSGLPPGHYFIVVQGAGIRATASFVKN